ncbi:MAG: hypothetical protein QM820_38950 [Minicystis sp.]
MVARAGVRPDIADVLAVWLEKQLLADQFARLEQAGHSDEGKIPLARVFVDLEVSTSPQSDAQDGGAGFVARVLRAIPSRLAQTEASELASEMGPRAHRARSGFVLIGGPGQGKSTVGQFLCQLHRAALLLPRAPDKMLGSFVLGASSPGIQGLTREGGQALDAIRCQCEGSALTLPDTGVLPVRVVLGELAAWIANTGATPDAALFDYLAGRIERSAGQVITPAELERILKTSPWLLVLDGLDEVPISGGRELMLAALREALRRLTSAGARGFVIGTTRPQGYGGELAGLDLETVHLLALTQENAINYARRLVEVRFADRPERQEKILDRLTQASKEEATARLMRSPLQVTIMATLVDRIGRAPQERWSLFQSYYRVIYEREMERPGPAAELLRKHRGHIDRIHAKVGLLLQVESERSGGTDALMSRERLEQVVEETLIEDDFEKSQRALLTRTILGAALDRLVFLVSPQDGRFGFEVRSIQEFMAAWALMSKSDAVLVEARLAQIAGATSFRNVFLFAASKCFSELSDLREAITDRLCPALNEADEVGKAILAGSRLALEILEEGSALNQPKYARRLMALAARLVELPPDECQVRLARVAEEDAEEPLRQTIAERMRVEGAACRLGTWVTLVAMIDAGSAWAQDLGEKSWPASRSEQQDVVSSVDATSMFVRRWLAGKMMEFLHNFPPSFVARLTFEGAPAWLSAISGLDGGGFPPFNVFCTVPVVEDGKSTAFELNVLTATGGEDSPYHVFANSTNPPPPWRPFVAAARLGREPTASVLAHELKWLAADYDSEAARWASKLVPWPLGRCLAMAPDSEHLLELSRCALAGDLGSAEEWTASEGVRTAGLSWTDFEVAATEDWLFGQPIATMAFSYAYKEKMARWIERLTSACVASSAEGARRYLTWFLIRALAYLPMEENIPSDVLPLRLFGNIVSRPQYRCPMIGLVPVLRAAGPGLDELAVLGDIGGRVDFYVETDRRGLAEPSDKLSYLVDCVEKAYAATPSGAGLLWMLLKLVVAGQETNVPAEMLAPQRFDDPGLQAAAILILFAQSGVMLEDTADAAAQLVASSARFDKPLTNYALKILGARDSDPSPGVLGFLLGLRRHTPDTRWHVVNDVLEALLEVFGRRSSALDDPAVWDRLALPLPKPAAPRSPTTPPPFGSASIQNRVPHTPRPSYLRRLHHSPRRPS